jgi:hypothetical protein
MRRKKKTHCLSPFLAGISSTFDLLGVQGISLEDIQKKNGRRLKENSIRHDFITVGKIIKRSFED